MRGTGEVRLGRAARLSLLSGLALIALLPLAAPAHAAFPGANGKIAFNSDRGGPFAIYLVHPDGTGLTQLVNSLLSSFSPTWSPAR